MDQLHTAQPHGAGGMAEVAARAANENLLFTALVELTYRCNLDCFFCYNDTKLRGEPLSLAEYSRFFRDLADLEVLVLVLTGGEPLAHPDFFELGALARELGFVVRVKSNGHALRGELARRLKDEVDPFVVEVSLHGTTAAVHDRQTRVAGSFDRLMANLDDMRRQGLRVQLNTTLTAWNEHQIDDLLALGEELGVKLQIDPEVTMRDDGDRAPLDILPSSAGVRRLHAAVRERAGRGAAVATGREADSGVVAVESQKHCGAGASTIAVDPYGEVYPCVQWRRSIGNLHRQSIKEMWTGSPVLDEVRDANRDVKALIERFGPAGPEMGFCPGAAWLTTGSPTELYHSALDKLAAAGGPSADRALLPVVR